MEHAGFLNSGRVAGDQVGGGRHGGSSSSGDLVDNHDGMGRDHVRPNLGLGLGNINGALDAGIGHGAADAHAGQGSHRTRDGIDGASRWGSGNQDVEDDVLMRNVSARREAHLKGLVNNDINKVWNHGRKFEGGFHCRYCNLRKKGGGATRFKEHLGHITGEVTECPNVPRNVKDAMRNALFLTRKKRREKATKKMRTEREIMDGMCGNGGVINIEDDEDEEIQMALHESLRDKNVSRAIERRRGSGSGVRVSLGKRSITAFFDKELSSNKVSVQPKITTAFDLESRDTLGQAWAKFFHANDIAGRKADCPYFRAAMKITQKLGPAPLPTAKEIDGIYLDKNYDEAEEWLKTFKQDWKTFGVTVMCDSWTGPTGMSIINFMVYCNEKMFFHKSIDASGQTQNAEFLYKEIKKVVVDEIGHENVVQLITDNGSNYKKACKTLVEEPQYDHIVWQPCAAHTVNLMLKDIAKFPEVDVIVKSAKQICRFFHNHSNLHVSMKRNVGGELIKPNATRFGTVFMFLESYHEKKDQFRKWMVSDDWKESIWKKDPDYVFAEALLSSNLWWAALEWVLNMLEPLYKALRYADTQKQCTLSGFKSSLITAINTLESRLGGGSEMLRRIMSKVANRIEAMEKDTLMVAAAVLDPHTHYVANLSKYPNFASALTDAIEKIADPDSAVLAIHEISAYRENAGRFGQRVARMSADKLSPTEWWFQFGGEVPNLQKYALRIVSQCVSSSGCERNWSAWALVHTKPRNRLLYGKLHKFVSVRYNLKIRAEEDKDLGRGNDKYKEVDPCAMMMDTAMFDEANPMMEWLNEDDEHVILDGSDAASAVFEEIRRLNSSKKASHLGRKDNGTKRKRVLEEVEDDYSESEDDDQENDLMESGDDDDSASQADVEDSPRRVDNEPPARAENEAGVTSGGGLVKLRRSVRGKQAKKVKLSSLYN